MDGKGDYFTIQLGGRAEWPRVDVTWPCRVRGDALEFVERPHCDGPLEACQASSPGDRTRASVRWADLAIGELVPIGTP